MTTEPQPITGHLVTRPQTPHQHTPALLAEQQRAITEIQAALTVAKSFPRDEPAAIERIQTACQRPGVAHDSSYSYSRGNEEIAGANIRLMEVIAQQWGNLDFGFRELARFPPGDGTPGESVCEAYAWDMQSNTRRKVQFTVIHQRETGSARKGTRRLETITDPRDIYEHIANMAQRRVRTCLENIIPRDVIDAALAQCDETCKATEVVTAEKIKAMLDGFARYGITREHIEGKLQRKLDSITPAQMVRMRKIFAALKDEMGVPSDFFDLAAAPDSAPKTAAEAAKEKLRKQQASKPAEQKPAETPSEQTADSAPADPQPPPAADEAEHPLDEPPADWQPEPAPAEPAAPQRPSLVDDLPRELADCLTISEVNNVERTWLDDRHGWEPSQAEMITAECATRREAIRQTRGGKSNK